MMSVVTHLTQEEFDALVRDAMKWRAALVDDAKAAPAHTDHPMRHYDRTCPACNAFVAVPKSDINDLLEYFEKREDASNEGDGWQGNEEMSFAQRLRELIGERAAVPEVSVVADAKPADFDPADIHSQFNACMFRNHCRALAVTATRYHWLRNAAAAHINLDHEDGNGGLWLNVFGDRLDRYIDAALSVDKGEKDDGIPHFETTAEGSHLPCG